MRRYIPHSPILKMPLVCSHACTLGIKYDAHHCDSSTKRDTHRNFLLCKKMALWNFINILIIQKMELFDYCWKLYRRRVP